MNQENVLPWERGLNKGKMNMEVTHKNLLDFKEVMDGHGIKYVMIFGGLLGLIRENRILPWDDDVEFFCFSEDHRKMKPVVEEMKSKGFYVPDRNECPLHDHFFIRGMKGIENSGEKLEIWWFTKIDNKEWIYDNTVRYPATFFDTLEEREFLGQKWKVPSNPETFLKVTYGNDWRTPNKNGCYILGR